MSCTVDRCLKMEGTNTLLINTWHNKLIDFVLMTKSSDKIKQMENPNYLSNFVATWFLILKYLPKIDLSYLKSACWDLFLA